MIAWTNALEFLCVSMNMTSSHGTPGNSLVQFVAFGFGKNLMSVGV